MHITDDALNDVFVIYDKDDASERWIETTTPVSLEKSR